MQGTMQATSSSLEALSRQYRAIVNNLANSNTAGYKRRMTEFVQALNNATSPARAGGLPTQSVTSKLLVDYTQGALTQTGRALDMALAGGGFFVIETPDGPLFSRNGAFHVNSRRELVDMSGRVVAGQSGPLILPPDTSTLSVTVSADGRISADGQQIGRLKIVEFDDPKSLIPVGRNCFRAPADAAPAPARSAKVQQGFQEASNVNIMQELVGLITVTRLYEANIKSIRVQDEQMKNILNVAMS